MTPPPHAGARLICHERSRSSVCLPLSAGCASHHSHCPIFACLVLANWHGSSGNCSTVLRKATRSAPQMPSGTTPDFGRRTKASRGSDRISKVSPASHPPPPSLLTPAANFSAGKTNPGQGSRTNFETIAIQQRLHLQAPGWNGLWKVFAATSPRLSHKAMAALLR